MDPVEIRIWIILVVLLLVWVSNIWVNRIVAQLKHSGFQLMCMEQHIERLAKDAEARMEPGWRQPKATTEEEKNE